MKITLSENGNELIMDNEDLDNPNFVDITLIDDDMESITLTVPIDQLQAALGAFSILRELREEHDERCEA